MDRPLNIRDKGNVRILQIDNPPVNALSWPVRSGLVQEIQKAERDANVAAIVLSCAGRTFVAGADISEFGQPPREPGSAALFGQFETSSKPIVTAMHGTVLGGGFELALHCHYRVALENTIFGLPETNLGLIPGGRGTILLPRIVGVQKAAEIITLGLRLNGQQALDAGLLDAVFADNIEDAAIRYAEKLISDAAPVRCIKDMPVPGNVDQNAVILDDFRRKLAKMKRNQVAPQKALDAIEASYSLPFSEAATLERELFENLTGSSQSKAMRHIFFAERQSSKVDGISPDIIPKKIAKAAVLGSGTMGGGIAMCLADAGIPTVIYDISQDSLDKGLGRCRSNYERSAQRGRIAASEVDIRMSQMTSSTNLEDVGDADIVIEAALEDMELKKQIFGQLDAICKNDAILSTNTSNLDVNEIAAATNRPNAVLGAHFFSPANVMRLLEVVRGKATDQQTLATVLSLAKRINKTPVVVGVCHGFVGNRMLHKYRDESFFMLEDGCLPQDVDAALYDWGMAMGPFAVSDLAGLDIGWKLRKLRVPVQGQRHSEIANKICELGRFGQKTGGGFYDYDPNTRARSNNGAIENLILNESKDLGILRRSYSSEEIVERTIFALVNEGAKILEDGIAQRASDIDVIYTSGYGFPIHRGGPMHYANAVGLENVYRRICEFDAEAKEFLETDERWTPAPLLKSLAENGGRFT